LLERASLAVALLFSLCCAQDAVVELEPQTTDEEIPEGASTLAFVFDVTGSMYDDLVQVIEGASKILETSLKRPKRPLYNFALVPFHDPEIGPVTITTDPKKFQYELRELYVQGGGDCPEMSIGAIKIALEISLPGSFIYVFTDARSKDYKLTHEVLQLIQQKQSQVVFVLTGDCDDRGHIGYKVYEEIASTSSGQVFHLDKKQVNEVLKWVEEAVQASKVHLLSTDHLTSAVNAWQIPFDPSLKEVTVSLSGPSPVIEVHDPLGKPVKKGSGLNELLNIENSATVVNIKEPAPGTWTIKTSSSGRHSVRITGLSTIDFRAGFSRSPTLDFKMTSSRPVQGIPTYILLNTTGIHIPARVDRLELLSITGELLKTVPVKYFPDRKPYGIWNISEFIPPNEAFFLKITGYDKDDYLFQRVSSVSFSNIIPDAPRVSMPKKTPGYYLQPGHIPCHVASLIPFTVYFSRNGIKLGMERFFKDSANVNWEIAKVSLPDEGYYECIASSSAGSGRAQTFLDVPNNVTVTPGNRAVLTCLTVSTVRYNLTWHRNNRDVKLLEPSRVRMMSNLSLEVKAVKLSDAGEYSCLASNEGGSTVASVFLTAVVSPKNQSFTEGSEVSIGCSATGYPKPTVVWTHNDMFLMGSHRYVHIFLPISEGASPPPSFYQDPEVQHRGPSVQSELLIALGDTTVMECKSTGVPPPQVKWFKGTSPQLILFVAPLIGMSPAAANVIEGQQLTLSCVLLAGNPIPERNIKSGLISPSQVVQNPYISVRSDGSLHLERVRPQDAGDYTCMASNVAGTNNKTTAVSVFVLPIIQHGQQIFSTIEGIPVTMPCKSSGVPKPSIVWSKVTANNLKFSVGSDGSLYVVSPGGEESGEYICTATNAAGYATRKVQLTVYVKPRVSRPGDLQGFSRDNPIEISVTAGEEVTLPCEVKSLPPPIITWVADSSYLFPVFSRHTFLPSGSMKITETRVSDSGMYLCVATNIAGNATQSVKLNVHVPPKIQRGPRVMKAKAGSRIDIPCNAHGIPPPTITWLKDQNPILVDNRQYGASSDGALRISKVLISDSGIYKCVASNIAGRDEAEIMVHVQGTIPSEPKMLERVAKERTAFPCPAKGTPKPVIKWLHNNKELTGNEPGISILEDGTLLVIASVTPYDNGEYVCVAVNEAGSTEKTYNLKVHVPPEIRDQDKVTNASVTINQPISLFCEVSGNPFPIITWYKADVQVCIGVEILPRPTSKINKTEQIPPSIRGADTPSEVSVVLNHDATLECRVSGTPLPIIQWFKDGKPLFLGDPNIEVLDEGQILHIKSARRIDKGRYQCSAANSAGKQFKELKLTIHVPPAIKGGNITTEVSTLLNSVLKLECETRGIPAPTITWYKDGHPIASSPEALYLDRGQFLQIPRAQVSDSAKYSCQATNVAGTAEKIFLVDVYVPPVIEGDSEAIQNKQVVSGSSLVLECNAAGNPPPLLTWLKDGVPVKASDNLHIVSGGRKLEIMNAGEADDGQYVCVATSIAGEKEIKYDVEILGVMEGENESTDYIVILHSSLELDCPVTGTPPPTITWLKNGQPIEGGIGYKILLNGRKLLISRTEVSDTGHYQCVATNKAGENKKEFDVTVHGAKQPECNCHLEGELIICIACWKSLWMLVFSFSVLEQLESSGRILQIARALMEDAGRYTCVATNAAGEAQQHVRLHVYGNGFPDMECSLLVMLVITWYKDNHPLTNTASVSFLNRGQVLQIDGAHISDTGVYKCVVANAAGIAELFYSLQVHVSPSISGNNEMVTVVVNNPVRLECEARGIPVPILTWLKDGSPVSSFSNGLQILSGGRILALTSAQISDSGRYTCVAVNAAGEKQRDIDLKVHVPPNIMGEEQNVSVVMGEDLELHCQSNAIPPPTLEWLKDGQPLLKKLGLSITEVQTQDTGRYTCEATNVAGKTEKNYNVNVWGKICSFCNHFHKERNSSIWNVVLFLRIVRPTILGSESQQSDVTVTRGNDISLECKAEGIPVPAVTWMKDGRPLVSGRGVEILDEGHRLWLKNSQVSDTGRYVCIAVNVAGLTDKKYDLSIHVPPSIAGDLTVPENISVVEKNPVTLICEASGIPHPSITWLKYGQPVSLSSSVRILSGGRMLRLMQVNMKDAGRYTCVVTNVAGEERKNYELSVLGEYLQVYVAVFCFFKGNPIPEITWLKDGQPFLEDDSHQLISNGRFLQVTNTQVSDTGRYTCIASNAAGDKSKTFSVNVLVSPSIVGADNDGGTEEVTVILNNPTSLVCEAYSYPPATITWLKDGAPIESNRNIRILPGGRTLQILNAQEDNTGRYTCIATNEAGEMLKHYEVKVYIPPTINRGDLSGVGLSPKEVKIRVNNSLTLECEAHAIPAAAIRWYKDGQASHQITSFHEHGRVLQIKSAQISDTGRYSCIASNIAGEDELEFDVNIQVPPNFRKPSGSWEDGDVLDGQGGGAKDVIMNNPLSLYCETNAVPPPVLTWYKDGYPLSSSDKVLILPGGRVLQIPRAQSEDAGRYTCVAVNEAGEDSIQYDVRVLLPPSIHGANGDMPEEVTVLISNMAVMECVANGSPNPSITWQKDGRLLVEDSQYVCTVENTAGSAKKYFNLNVHVPPSIVGTNPENLTVVVNNFISLTCEVTGFPPPDLSWLKNGKPISLNTNALIVPGGRTLQIPRARLSDGGEYVCIARNSAGESRRKSFLTIYVPPSIKDHSGAALSVVNVRVGTPVTLECESNAVPPPVISWYKNGRMILLIRKVVCISFSFLYSQVSDTGQYVCKAINIAGRDDKNFHLNCNPSIEGPDLEWINETISNPVTFSCDATGIPPPTITWLKDGKPLVEVRQHLDSHGGITNTHFHHLKVPPDIAGSEMPSDVSVILGENIQLSCKAHGIPAPAIQWLRDGKPISGGESPRISLAPDGSLLSIVGALTSDVGKYTCVASNPAGEEDRIFNVNVYVPPTITNNKDEPEALTVLLETSINIECQAVGTPPPQINWLKNGLPLSISTHIRLLSAGQILRIVRAQIADVGMYTCVASNRAGVDNNGGGTEEVTVVKGNPVSLVCSADGTPTPNMSWLKDGQPLNFGFHVSLENQGMGLHIAKSETDDTGRYTCIASNDAGEANKHFTLKVLEPPQINGSGHPEEISIVVNKPLELFCISDGIPIPKITWMKDGRPVPQTDDIRILRGGEVLRISSAQVTVIQTFSCVPPNIAGTSNPQNLSVLQNRQIILECKSDAVPPPTITWLKNGEIMQVCVFPLRVVLIAPTIKGGPQTVTVNINMSAVLECAPEGIPAPRVSWRKDGTLFAENNASIPDHPLPEPDNGSLHIHSAHVTDTGRYLCMATNVAGTERKRIDLHVHVPPTVAPGPGNITVTVNVQTTLPCETTGIPKPAVIWKKNRHLLNVDQNRNTFRLLSSGSLVIISPIVDDTALYECMVSNEAGEDQRAIALIVQVPPSLADEAADLLVTKSSPVMIPCSASGVPSPTIHWTKNGIRLLPRGDGYRILSSGTIEIAAAQLDHAGKYTCTAQNAAGSAHRHVTLHVQEPPAIKVQPGMLDVILNSPILLPCEAVGSPRPKITWQKEGVSVNTTGIFYTILPSGSLQIAKAAAEDAGTYICVAQNPAGTALGKIKLKIQVPPAIRSHPEEYVVVLDKPATLLCEADGYPAPEIVWHKDGQQVTESMRQRILSMGSLQIAFAHPSDTGRYTCTATNVAGANTHTVNLTVHVLPTFTELPGDLALNKGERLQLTCKAVGVPVPQISWTFNNNIIPVSTQAQYDGVNGLSQLVIERVSKEDSGTYVCTAENVVGSVKALGFVYVKEPPVFMGDYHSSRIEPLGGNAILNCEVRGDPPPVIQWSKKGAGIQISNRIRQLSNGSLAIYGTVNEDAAEYACVATNDAGVVEHRVTLTLHSAPVITIEPVETIVDAGTTVMLNCQAEGEPPPTIEWSRQGRPLLSQDRMTVLTNGSLLIAVAHKKDTSEYECVARNLMGSVLVKVPLIVQGGPPRARGSVIGNINDVEFGIAFLNATIIDSPDLDTRRIQAKITNIPRSLGPAMRALVSILSPIYWTTAKENGGAVNGFSLTNAVFKRETQVEFATGEILRMTHVARGLDSDGSLLLDVVISGHMLQLQSSPDVNVKDYTEDYIQTGPGQLYAYSTRLFTIDGVSVPYTWNHTITYDPNRGRMPFLVETLQAASVETEYNALEEALTFKIRASITKDQSNQCPNGFGLDSAGPYCTDEDECTVRNPCSHTCHNAIGTYYCSCPKGLTISADGRACQDIDECALGRHSCHAGQDCENIIGSYHCVVRCGTGFRRTSDGLNCQDVNECQESNPCNQRCFNTIGSFHCGCEPGYQLKGIRLAGHHCKCLYTTDINECEQVPRPCAYQCANSPGSFKCICPPGQHLLGDGKSCAGLERLPDYGSYYNSHNYAQFSLERDNYRPQQYVRHSSNLYSSYSEYRNSRGPISRTKRNFRETCPEGYEARSNKCIDINECENRDACQHDCRNTLGSYQCFCPAGYQVMPNGKTCQDIDECLEQNIHCGPNRMCFNTRGSYQCIDTPCPPNYQRDPLSGCVYFRFCLKNCPPNDLECALSPYALEYKFMSLPFGIAANQDLIRLVAYTEDGVMHPRTTFLMVNEDLTIPFALRDENLKGVVYTTRPLREPETYRMRVRALSYSVDGAIEYQTTFIVYIAVSAYPY
uniref:Hemicentin 1 n=1 Tax=Podarcis muralis TaxID=64176 RepID=A0A670IF80_PODMU